MSCIRLTLVAVFIFCLAAAGQAAEQISLAMATKPGVGQSVAAEKFKEALETRSGGRLVVKLVYGPESGGDLAILKRLKSGRWQMGIANPGPWENWVPETRVVEFPFLFADTAQAEKALDGPAGQTLLKALEQGGFKGLAFGENGFRHLTNNLRPIQKAADVKGLKLRIMDSPLHMRLWRLLGAKPVPHEWPINDFLARGGVDGQENPLEIIWGYRLDQQQKFLSLTGHVYSAPICAANLAWFKSLSSADRGLVQAAMSEAAQFQRRHNRQGEANALAQLRQAGMQVTDNPDRQSFRRLTQDMARDAAFRRPKVRSLLGQFQKAVQ